MRNAQTTQAPTALCNSCDRRGFFSYTPDGADYTTCPVCGDGDFVNFSNNHHRDDDDDAGRVKMDVRALVDMRSDKEDARLGICFCARCRILFDAGCMHAVLGCTDNCYNGHVVGAWRNRSTGEVHDVGMPVFDGSRDWFDRVRDVEVLRWFCPNRGAHCSFTKSPDSSYTKARRPQYYGLCKEAESAATTK